MRIHREGYAILTGLFLVLAVISILVYWFLPAVLPYAGGVSIILFLLVLQFFRHPRREIDIVSNRLVYAPADGRVVVIEETQETEYFQDRRIQVSIFMSPVNVHVNRNPIGGEVKYLQHHPGKYLVAWHPKSSTENERTTVVIGNADHVLLIRQIAGALAKRIRNYLQVGQVVKQGSEMGFIRFGSRVDVFLPLDTEIMVSIGDKARANRTVIAKLKG